MKAMEFAITTSRTLMTPAGTIYLQEFFAFSEPKICNPFLMLHKYHLSGGNLYVKRYY